MFFYQMSLPLPASSQNSTKMKNHSSLLYTQYAVVKKCGYEYCGCCSWRVIVVIGVVFELWLLCFGLWLVWLLLLLYFVSCGFGFTLLVIILMHDCCYA